MKFLTLLTALVLSGCLAEPADEPMVKEGLKGKVVKDDPIYHAAAGKGLYAGKYPPKNPDAPPRVGLVVDKEKKIKQWTDMKSLEKKSGDRMPPLLESDENPYEFRDLNPDDVNGTIGLPFVSAQTRNIPYVSQENISFTCQDFTFVQAKEWEKKEIEQPIKKGEETQKFKPRAFQAVLWCPSIKGGHQLNILQIGRAYPDKDYSYPVGIYCFFEPQTGSFVKAKIDEKNRYACFDSAVPRNKSLALTIVAHAYNLTDDCVLGAVFGTKYSDVNSKKLPVWITNPYALAVISDISLTEDALIKAVEEVIPEISQDNFNVLKADYLKILKTLVKGPGDGGVVPAGYTEFDPAKMNLTVKDPNFPQDEIFVPMPTIDKPKLDSEE